MNVKLSKYVRFGFFFFPPEAVRNTLQVLCALPLCINMPVQRAEMKEKLGDCQWVRHQWLQFCAVWGRISVSVHWVKAAPVKYIQVLSINPLCQGLMASQNLSRFCILDPISHSTFYTLLELHNTQTLFPDWPSFSQTLWVHAWPWTFGVAVSSSWNPFPSALYWLFLQSHLTHCTTSERLSAFPSAPPSQKHHNASSLQCHTQLIGNMFFTYMYVFYWFWFSHCSIRTVRFFCFVRLYTIHPSILQECLLLYRHTKLYLLFMKNTLPYEWLCNKLSRIHWKLLVSVALHPRAALFPSVPTPALLPQPGSQEWPSGFAGNV